MAARRVFIAHGAAVQPEVIRSVADAISKGGGIVAWSGPPPDPDAGLDDVLKN
jgi:hypothetical protein